MERRWVECHLSLILVLCVSEEPSLVNFGWRRMKSTRTTFFLLRWSSVSLLFLALGLLLEGSQFPWLWWGCGVHFSRQAMHSTATGRKARTTAPTVSAHACLHLFVKLNPICPFLIERTQSGKDRSRVELRNKSLSNRTLGSLLIA